MLLSALREDANEESGPNQLLISCTANALELPRTFVRCSAAHRLRYAWDVGDRTTLCAATTNQPLAARPVHYRAFAPRAGRLHCLSALFFPQLCASQRRDAPRDLSLTAAQARDPSPTAAKAHSTPPCRTAAPHAIQFYNRTADGSIDSSGCLRLLGQLDVDSHPLRNRVLLIRLEAGTKY